MAACGVEMLVQLIKEGGLAQPQRLFQPKLQLRDSTAASKC
jgi:DNA-binding LacI/PurR family transcriptional regulator